VGGNVYIEGGDRLDYLNRAAFARAPINNTPNGQVQGRPGTLGRNALGLPTSPTSWVSIRTWIPARSGGLLRPEAPGSCSSTRGCRSRLVLVAQTLGF
jgi:hypothetical protein